jgi:hypothetical protein
VRRREIPIALERNIHFYYSARDNVVVRGLQNFDFEHEAWPCLSVAKWRRDGIQGFLATVPYTCQREPYDVPSVQTRIVDLKMA